MKKSILLLATIAAFAPWLPVPMHAATQVYDVKADWSDSQNPNGPWSYREGTNLLRSVPYGISVWVGSINNFRPMMYSDPAYVTVEPACIPCGQGVANILWTAPSAGTIDISGDLSDLGAFGSGDVNWALSLNGNLLSGGYFGRNDYYAWGPLFYFSLGSGGPGVLHNIPVAAGDQVMLAIGDGPVLGAGSISVNFTITLTEASLDPVAAIEDLALTVVHMNLQNGIENSLDSKLDAALDALVDANFNNDGAACNSLAAFINAVQAQRGKKITNAQADQLVTSAQQIRGSLNCGN